MPKTIAVVKVDGRSGGWKVLVNYIQRGVNFQSMQIANREATSIFDREQGDHLILAKEEC